MYKILTKGKKSFDVISMQQLLNKVNKENRIIVDGHFGNKTQESLKQRS